MTEDNKPTVAESIASQNGIKPLSKVKTVKDMINRQIEADRIDSNLPFLKGK